MPDRDRPLFLSIDAGTTKFRACVLNDRLDVVWVEEVVIDDELPEYGTRNGVYTLGDCITCPSELRLKALDLLLEKLARECPDPSLLSRVRAVSGAGQPHTLHYLLPAFPALLTTLDTSPTSRLSGILTTSSAFALEAPATSSDSSTSSQVRLLEQHFGQLALPSSTTASSPGPSPSPSPNPSTVSEAGRVALAQRTGSRPWTRFSAAQLLKVRQGDERDLEAQKITRGEGVLERTARIVLESGLLAAVFLGRLAPVDAADACLTNLLDPSTCDWDDEMLDFVMGSSDSDDAGVRAGADRLREMFGAVERDGGVELGKVSSYFVKRFGFSPDCIVAPFTGTDPATFLSFPLATTPGRRDALISLSVSDSDTLMVPSPAYIPHPERHLMVHPAKASWEDKEGGEEYVAMVSSKDAAVGRALSRDLYCNGQWSVFTHLTAIVPHGGTLGLDDKYFSFFFPHGEASIAQGFLRFGSGARIPEFPDRKANPRLLLESQFLSLRIRLSHIYAALATRSSPSDDDDGVNDELAALPGYDPLGFPALSSSFLPTRLVLVGPAAQNPAMSSILSTIFNAPAFLPLASGLQREAVQGEEIEEGYVGREDASERKKTTNSALGAGYKAAWAWARTQGEEQSFGEFLARMIDGFESVEVEEGVREVEDDPLEEGKYALHHRPETASTASGGPSHLSLLHDSAGGSSTSAYYEPAPTRGGRLKAEEAVEGREQQLEDDPPGLSLVAMPDWDEWRYYSSMLPEYVRLEKSALKGLV